MGKLFSNRLLLFKVMVFILFFTEVVSSQKRSLKAWEISKEVEIILPRIPTDINPTLPAPRIVKEPEYTLGYDNTIYWYGDSTRSEINEMGMNILYFEIQANYKLVELDTTELWGYVDGNTDVATFKDLPEGIRIDYKLRYVVQDSEGEYKMSYWSSIEWSIQDTKPPVLWVEESGVLNLNVSGNKRWVEERTIQIQTVTSDSSFGKVMQIAIHESSVAIDDTTFDSNFIPNVYINKIFPYSLKTPERIPVTINWWVYDVAGQRSEENDSETFFVWSPKEGEPKMLCFPNPFNPENNEISTIKVDFPDVTEAQIFDPFGNLIRSLTKEPFAGFFEWDGKNGRGDVVSNGGYICVLKGNDQIYCKIAVIR